VIETCELLLTGGSVVTVDDERRVFEPGAVAITGDRIVAVGTPEDLARVQADRTIDCSGRAVIPGLVDCHQHLFQYIVRGLGEGLELWPWLSDFMWPVVATILREDAVAAARLAAVEAVRAGVTCVLDHHYAPTDLETTLGVAGAIEEVGLRGIVARGMAGEVTAVARDNRLSGDLFRYSTAEELEITRACMEARPPGSRVAVWPAPVNIIYCDQALVRDAVELAREFHAGWHTHCSEAAQDPVVYEQAYGDRPVRWLGREELLGEGTVLAHGIFLDDDEVAELGDTRSAVAYCPVSHEYIGLGVMRLADLRRAGAVVGLGCDGASGHRWDIFDAMKHGVLLQRVHHRDPTASTVEEAIELATREGARALGVDAGMLAPGRLADIAIVDLRGAHLAPVHRTVAALVHCARGSDVETTIIGGEVVYERGQTTRVDADDAAGELRERANALVARAGLRPLTEPWRAVTLPA
jgi:5-methylthioadenosine/S-adenosylhomocysteine deaminase